MAAGRELQWVSSKEERVKDDPNFDRKLDAITAGAPPHLREHSWTKISKENCKTIINYVLAMETEIAPSES
jgi:hypothetical protein